MTEDNLLVRAAFEKALTELTGRTSFPRSPHHEGDIAITNGVNIMKLTREEAINEIGIRFVESVEAAPCDYSNRVTNDGTVEFCATVKAGFDEDGFSRTITAVYFQDSEKADGCEDLGDLEWIVDHYTVQ